MNIDQKLDYYIARCDALDAEGIGALLKAVKAERVRLRDYLSPDQHAARICRAQNDATLKAAQGGVTEAMVERVSLAIYARAMESGKRLDPTFCDDLATAALSAEPAAQEPIARIDFTSRPVRLVWFRLLPGRARQIDVYEHAAQRVPEEATDEFVPRWWDDSHGGAYKEGWNDCRAAMLAATPAAPAEEGDGAEGDDCERCNGIGGWGRLYDGPSHLPSIACPDCNGTGKKPTGAAR